MINRSLHPLRIRSQPPCGETLAMRGIVLQMARVDSPFDQPRDDHARGVTLEAMRTPLIGYFRKRVPQQDDVLDLVQEVFLRVSNRGALDDIANLRSYMFQVADSVLTDRQRRRVVRHSDAHVEFDPERMGEAEIGPERILAGRDALQRALAALDQLPERTRTIFVLRRLEGMRYLDIAKRLGLSVSAVEKQMVRAVAHLAAAGDIR
jgi:RNA polymerase sigma factor (sigma-70 family)